MNRLDHQDRKRYWKISQVRDAAHIFAGAAERGFTQSLAHLAEGEAKTALSAMGPVFSLTGDRLDEVKGTLDRAIDDRTDARTDCRLAGQHLRSCADSQRRLVRRTRQFADSQTDGKGDLHLGVRGATPRDPENLAVWGDLFYHRLPETKFPLVAQGLVRALTEELELSTRELREADRQAVLAQEHVKTANLVLSETRKAADAEVDKVVRFLRSSLELVGEDELARRVLGKRRGRPRKSAKERQEAFSEPSEVGRKSDSAPSPGSEGGQEFDSAPSPASEVGRKSDSVSDDGVAGPCAERRIIEEAPIMASAGPEEMTAEAGKASTAPGEITAVPSGACTALEKIVEGPCKPCTETSQMEEVVFFQQDTPRSTRLRRRRVAAVLLGASKRWLPSGRMGRLVAGQRGRRRGFLPPAQPRTQG